MSQNEIFIILISTGISTIFSIISSLILLKIEFSKNRKKEKFDEYYASFYTLWDTIHQGRAYDFSDLSCIQQEKIIEFFIKTNRYQDKEVRNLVYELKTSRLDNFDNCSLQNIDSCNKTYRELTTKIITEYDKKCKCQ